MTDHPDFQEQMAMNDRDPCPKCGHVWGAHQPAPSMGDPGVCFRALSYAHTPATPIVLTAAPSAHAEQNG